MSYGALRDEVNGFAAYLVAAGVRKGDRVALLSPNCAEYAGAFLGTLQAGGIAAEIDYHGTNAEIEATFRKAEPVAAVVAPQHAALVEDIAARTSRPSVIVVLDGSWSAATRQSPAGVTFPDLTLDDTACIAFTSGTTGAPKGVVLTHGNLLANASAICESLGLTSGDSVMVVLPFCYSYGKSLLTTHLLVGGALVLSSGFTYPNVVLDQMRDESVTGFAGVPSTYASLLRRSTLRTRQLPRLRYVTQAGGAMPVAHITELASILGPEKKLFLMYGQTEATARLTILNPSDLQRKMGSIGKPIGGVTIELVKADGSPAAVGEEGEIVASGKGIMAGYWKDPEATGRVLRDGRLFTGDLATRDAEGFLTIVGRRSDLIKCGGHRVSPREIEEVLLLLPEVSEVAVLGKTDEILGESVAAFLVAEAGMTLEAEAVRRHCRQYLAAFKVPTEVTFVSSLPKTASGKIRRHLLKQAAEPV